MRYKIQQTCLFIAIAMSIGFGTSWFTELSKLQQLPFVLLFTTTAAIGLTLFFTALYRELQPNSSE